MKLHLANLLEAMRNQRVTQADMHRALKWSEAKVSRLVRGKTGDVNLTQINELAALLRVSAATLTDLEDVAQTDDERQILRDYRLASDHEKGLVRHVLATPLRS
jgi:transcriptional regulator with XRE-family HTH domain